MRTALTARVARWWRALRRTPLNLVLVALAAVLVVVIVVQVVVAIAARPAPGAAAAIAWSTVQPGADASWPSCTPPRGTKRLLPLADRPAFVVVGVNDGLPGTRSACIERELRWADTVIGGSSQPPLDYYVMAADRWQAPQLRYVPHPEWPTSNRVGATAVPVPSAFASLTRGTTCGGEHTSRACAYVDGWAMAQADAALPELHAAEQYRPERHRFWIDVEAVDDWNADPLFNQAVVEGMVAAFSAPPSAGGIGATVGIYSDTGEWARIIGPLRAGSPLDGLDEWLAIGRATHTQAVDALLHERPLTPHGRIRMVQYLDGAVDRDLARPAEDR